MNNSTKVAVYLIGLGMALTAFAYTNFATKEEVKTVDRNIKERLNLIHEDVKYIKRKLE